MQTQLTDVLASVHGNEITSQDFMLVKQAPQPVDESAAQAQQIAGLFQAASAENAAH